MTLSGKRILVVEDEALVAAMIEDILVRLGATIVGPASSIETALELAAGATFDAALLDINVRGKRIDPVVQRLRDRGIPMVFASGYGLKGLPPEATESVVEKPLRVDKLAAALLRVV